MPHGHGFHLPDSSLMAKRELFGTFDHWNYASRSWFSPTGQFNDDQTQAGTFEHWNYASQSRFSPNGQFNDDQTRAVWYI